MARWIVRFGVIILNGASMDLVLSTGIALGVVPVSCTMDLWAGVMINVLTGATIGVASGIGLDVLTVVNPNMWLATMTVLGSVLILESLIEALICGW